MEQQNYMQYCRKIKNELVSLGIRWGDILYVASDVIQVIKTAQTDLQFRGHDARNKLLYLFVDILQDIVGRNGTLLFPMYNWDFCRGLKFSYNQTRSKVGALNNFILDNRKEFRRTKHPLYSFMVWGRDQEKLCLLDNQEAWGSHSPFAYLRENDNAKQLSIGVEMSQGLTYVHFLEQLVQVPYRHHKFFLGEYEDEHGNIEFRSYSQYVRKLSVETEYILTDSFLISNCAMKKKKVFGWNASVVCLRDVEKVVMEDLKEGAKNIYHIKNYDVKKHFETARNEYEIGLLAGYDLAR